MMNLKTWNGFAINDAINYEAIIPEDAPLLAQTKAQTLERSEAWPLYGGKKLNGINLPILIAIRGGNLETLKAQFDTEQQEMYQLVANDGSEDWYLEGTPVTVTAEGPRAINVVLFIPDPVWRSSAQYTEGWAVTASGQTKTIANNGKSDVYPIFEITPLLQKTGGSGYKRWIPVYNQLAEALVRYPVNLTDNGTGTGVLDTAALVTAGKMLANGGDLCVKVDGKFYDRYLSGINTSSTKVWINLDLQPGISMTLNTSLADTGEVTEISVVKTTANINAMEKLPQSGIVLIDSEAFSYTEVHSKKCLLSGVTRAEKGTTAAAHSVGAVIRWIEHDIWMLYGDSTAWQPTVDNAKMPIFELGTSTNLTWVYANFEDADSKRSGEWESGVVRSKWGSSIIYTGVRGAVEDPSTEMGMSIITYYNGLKYKTEEAILKWRLNHPAGITKISSSGEIRRLSADWPIAKLDKLHPTRDGEWINLWALSTPTAVSTWQTWTQQNITVSPTAKSVRFRFDGSVGGGTAINQADFSVKDVTITLDSTGIPVVKLNSEQGKYLLDARITNQTTGEYIDLTWVMKIGQTLIVNCEARTIIYANIVNALSARTLSSVRRDWLNLKPGDNIFKFEDLNTTGVTLNVKYRKRAL